MRNGLQKQINILQKDMSNIVNATGALVANKAIGAKDLVVDSGSNALSAFTKVIKNRPIAAIGIAFGLGFVAMRLVRR